MSTTIIRTGKEDLKRFLQEQLAAAEAKMASADPEQRRWAAGVLEGLEKALDVVLALEKGHAPGTQPSPVIRRLRPTLNAREEGCLERIWDGPAWRKWEEGERFRIIFPDACQFWGLGHDPKGRSCIDQTLLREFTSPLESVAEKLEQEGEVVLSTGRSLSSGDVDRIMTLDGFLQQQFLRHLNLLRNRYS